MTSKPPKPSALKTFGVIVGTLIAIPAGFLLLWWLVVGVLSLFEVVHIEPGMSETREARYVYRRTSIDDTFNAPDRGYQRGGERVFFFDGGENAYVLKSYDLKDTSVVTWAEFPKSGSPPMIVTAADSIFIYRNGEGLFRKTSPLSAAETSPWGEKIAPPIPEDCGSGRDLELALSGEGILAACLPRDMASTLVSVFVLVPGRSEWIDRSPTGPWKDGLMRGHAVDGNGVFLVGETQVHRFDVVRRRLESVGNLKGFFEDSTYQPLLGRAGDAVFLAAGDDLLFWDGASASFRPVFEPSSKYTLWYDDYAGNRIYVQGDEALIQVSGYQGAAHKGLGYFRKDASGAWVYRGVMEDVSMAQPVALADASFYYGDRSGLVVRDIGLETCRAVEERVFGGSFDWFPKLARGGTISGYVLNAAPELCRVDIAVPASLGEKGDFRSLRVELASVDAPSNFEALKAGDHVTATVVRWRDRYAVIDRVHIDLRDGALPAEINEGQTPLSDQRLTLAAILSCFAVGVVSLIVALRRMSQAARVCLARIFSTEEAVRSAERLRTVGLAVLGSGFLALTAKLQPRPADLIGFLEAFSLQLGVFLVLFALLYYVAAVNLLKFLNPKPPKVAKNGPIPSASPSLPPSFPPSGR